MDKKSFLKLYNLGLLDVIIAQYCIEKGKTEQEVELFINKVNIEDAFSLVKLKPLLIDYIISDISRIEPITFLYNTQHQLLKVF